MAKQLFLFKQSTLLGKGKVGHKNSAGHIYHRGVHSLVDPDHAKDPTFLHFEKHGLVEEYVPEKQGELKEASSDVAKVSQDAAKSQQLEPDAEIGGDSEPNFDAPKHKKKGR